MQDEINAIFYHKEYKSLEKIINSSLFELNVEQSKVYKIDFSFNRELSEKLGQKSYDALVNGVKANEIIKQDSQISKALDGFADHKDIQQKGITAEALKSGAILDNELKVNRPEARVINAVGSKIKPKSQEQQAQKSKGFSL